jgi:hypothetical protein
MSHQSLAAQSAGECEESRREALVAMVQTTDSGNGVTFQTLGAGIDQRKRQAVRRERRAALHSRSG